MLFDFPRDLLLLKAGTGRLVEDTATGNPLTFNANVAKPLRSLLIPFTPVQSGTGDPSPDNVRPIAGITGLTAYHAGKNLFDVSTYPFTASRRISGEDGQVGSNSSFKATLDFIPCSNIAGKTVTLNKRCGGNAPGIGFYSSAEDSAFVSGLKNAGASAGIPWTFEVPSNAKYMRFTVTADATDIQIELGTTATAYKPYVPVASFPVVFPAMGKNLFNKDGSNILNAYISTGYVENLSAGKTVFVKCKPNTTYTVSKTAGQRFAVAYTKATPANGVPIYGRIGDNTAASITITTGEDAEYVVAFVYNASVDTVTADEMLASVQIEEGNHATAYEPFTNTVYGGTLDLVTGVLSVEWAGYSAKWEDGTNETSIGDSHKRRRFTLGYNPQTGSTNNFCNVAPYKSGNEETTKFNVGTNGFAYVILPNETSESKDVQVVSKLATPRTIQLDPVTVNALVGDNTVWSDTNGENTAVYLKKA